MAKPRCVLCGKELSLFHRNELIFYRSSQSACSDCSHAYGMAEGDALAALNQRILASPHLEDRESVLLTMAWLKAEEQKKTALEKARIKYCPRCNALMDLKLNTFQIGSRGDSLLGDRYEVDLYACPKCGKVELFTAGFIPPDEDYSAVTCPICGTQHRWPESCPNCTPKEAADAIRPERNSPEKPRWEK